MPLLVMDIVVSLKYYRTMKARNEKLMKYAQDALNINDAIWTTKYQSILDAYNGQIAALSVAVAISGLRPTLAIYYQDKPNAGTIRKANRRTILDLIAKMISLDENIFFFDNAEALLRHAVSNNADLLWLKKEVIECAIALKQVVRTYNLVSK